MIMLPSQSKSRFEYAFVLPIGKVPKRENIAMGGKIFVSDGAGFNIFCSRAKNGGELVVRVVSCHHS